MRLSLALALLVGTTGGCALRAAHQASARVHVYDDARLSLVSPAIRDDVQFGDSRLAADYTVDVVSGATQALTVDAVSSATRFSEQRHQVGVSGGHALSRETELSGGYTLSYEPDHTVHAPSLGLTRELMDQQVRALVRYQLLVESISRVDDASFSSHALGHRLDLGWTQIATPSVVVVALVTTTAHACGAAIGCYANPYRYVGVTGLGSGQIALGERHPETRFTGAGALRLSWALGDANALHTGYRFATDSWRVTAHTVDTALATEVFQDRLLVRAEARTTLQSAASFYRSGYVGDDGSVPAYRTADSELSSLWNLKLQLHLEWAWEPVRLVGEFGRMWNEYPDFAALPHRHAWLGSLGLDAQF